MANITLDVASVLQQGRDLQTSQVQSNMDLAELLRKNPALDAAQQAAIKDQGAALAETEAAKQARMAQQDAQLAQINSQAGILGEQGMFAETAAQLREMDARLAPMRDALIAKQNISIADNPIDWLLNQFTLPGEIKNYNALVDGRDGLEQQLQARVQSATAAGNMSRTLAAQTSEAEAAGRMHEISAATNVAATNATIEAAQRSINALSVQATFNKLPFETAKDMLSIRIQAENLDLAKQREQREKNAESRDMRLYELRVKALDAEIRRGSKSDAEVKDIDQRAQMAATIMGETIKSSAELATLSPQRKAAYATIMGQLDLTKPISEQTITFGADLAEAIQLLDMTNTQLKGGKAELVAKARQYMTNQEMKFVDKANPNLKFKQLTPEQQAGWRRQWASEFERSYTDPNVPGSIYNMFTVAGLKTAQFGAVDLSKSDIVTNLEKQYGANSMAPVTVESIIGTSIGLVRYNVGNPAYIDKLAREGAALFKARQIQFYAAEEPQRVGMQVPDKVMYTYSAGTFDNAITYDLGNPTDFKNLLLRSYGLQAVEKR